MEFSRLMVDMAGHGWQVLGCGGSDSDVSCGGCIRAVCDAGSVGSSVLRW